MTSLLAWVDYSGAHREGMDRLLDAFRDKGTVDELGIGTIRDTFSDTLFPGTSTLHTRARYLLFVPWAVTATTVHRYTLDRAVTEMRRVEVRLIHALLNNNPEPDGVIGRDAKAALKRMPSEVYWGAITRFGIKRCDHGIQQHLRAATAVPTTGADEEDGPAGATVDPCFRELPPPPSDWLETIDFDLTADETAFLREQILTSCPDAYLSWLLLQGAPGDVPDPWEPELAHGLPATPARVLGHAYRFSQLFLGAPILYNLLLARHKNWYEGIEQFHSELESWAVAAETRAAVEQWDRRDFWLCLHQGRWNPNRRTQDFVDAWVDLLRPGPQAVLTGSAAGLIENRERRLKGSRSRFVNADALAAWEGGAGMGAMRYRWSNVRTLLNDLSGGGGDA